MAKGMKRHKTIAKLKKDCERQFNAFIRRRDYGNPCISCGKYNYLQAGHYYAVSGYDGLRFDEDNVNGECTGCNNFNHSHLITYGINLEKKIGKERMEALHQKARDYKKAGFKKMTRQEIIDLTKHYRELNRNQS